jgi:hypothetical protein
LLLVVAKFYDLSELGVVVQMKRNGAVKMEGKEASSRTLHRLFKVTQK